MRTIPPIPAKFGLAPLGPDPMKPQWRQRHLEQAMPGLDRRMVHEWRTGGNLLLNGEAQPTEKTRAMYSLADAVKIRSVWEVRHLGGLPGCLAAISEAAGARVIELAAMLDQGHDQAEANQLVIAPPGEEGSDYRCRLFSLARPERLAERWLRFGAPVVAVLPVDHLIVDTALHLIDADMNLLRERQRERRRRKAAAL